MTEKKENFFKKLINKFDKKLQEKSEKTCSCNDDSEDKKCCS